MGDWMTVGDLVEALKRYDPDRVIGYDNTIFERVVSIEPGGAVILRPADDKMLNPYTGEVEARKSSGSWLGGFLGE